MLIWNETKDIVKYGDYPDQSQSFRTFARSSHCCKLRKAPKNYLYEQFASYVNRACINGSCRVLCKPRPELTQSVQKQIVK